MNNPKVIDLSPDDWHETSKPTRIRFFWFRVALLVAIGLITAYSVRAAFDPIAGLVVRWLLG